MIFTIKVDIFANILIAIRFKKITYYTIHIEDEETNLFLQFINNHKSHEYNEQMAIIRAWLRKLGEEIGAQERYFRFEGFRGGDARALPPPARYINVDCDLRLYCMRLSDGIVFLFNGAAKTENNAQDCDNVRPHFILANKITQAIDQALKDGDIKINETNRRLDIREGLIIEL